jgi:ribulose-bisphosphate carboxylase large chain
MERLRVTYRLDVTAARAHARADEVAHEQTVEVPPSAVVDPFVADEILGTVEDITPAPDGGQLATIAYPVAITAADPAQLLNVVFGNSSLQADVECVDIELPAALLRQLGGPRHGIAGLRRATGVYGRALTCTAVKPMGQSAKALADLLRVFARSTSVSRPVSPLPTKSPKRRGTARSTYRT